MATLPLPNHQQRARRLWQQGVQDLLDNRPVEAATALRECVVLHPGFACAWNDLGVLMETLGNYTQARACYEAALRAAPGHHQARENFFSLLLRFDLMQALHRAAA